jgi:hypothetical protein
MRNFFLGVEGAILVACRPDFLTRKMMMTKDGLLKLIAESGYNIGYAAKKHLATFDIVEKVPGWLALLSIAAGIGALFIPELEQKFVSATFLVLGVTRSS